MVVIFGTASTVEASTSRPTFAPSSRSQTGVNRLAYSGNSPTRAMSISRSVAHTCQPRRLCTGWKPARMPMLSSRTDDEDQQRVREQVREGRERHGEQAPRA